MGVVENVGALKWPKQGSMLKKKVRVCFNYNTDLSCDGIIVRDDIEYPFRSIIRLDDGRHVLTTECQWSPITPPKTGLA